MEIKPYGEKLPLKTNGELWLVFLGVGSAFATENDQTNFLLIQGDHHVLVDFGMTGPQALKNVCGLSVCDIEVVLPTHSHADHVGGLEGLALMNRYVGMRFMDKPKAKMIIDENYQRVLWDYTLRGGLEWNEKDLDSSQKLDFSDFFDVIRPKWKTHQPREIYTVQHGPMKIELFRTSHIPEQSNSWEASFISYGLFVNDHLFISGDTKFDHDLIRYYAPQSDVMFHDVQFFPGAVHAHLADLKTLPDDIKKKMYLMHYADNWGEQEIYGEFAGWAQPRVIYSFEDVE